MSTGPKATNAGRGSVSNTLDGGNCARVSTETFTSSTKTSSLSQRRKLAEEEFTISLERRRRNHACAAPAMVNLHKWILSGVTRAQVICTAAKPIEFEAP